MSSAAPVSRTDGPEMDAQLRGRSVNFFGFSLIAIVVGIITGFGAVFFRALIAVVHNLFFFGRLSTHFDANEHTLASPWGVFIILAPVVGGMGVVFL